MLGFLSRLFGGGGPDPREQARIEADQIIRDAEQAARGTTIEAQEQTLELRGDMESEIREMRVDVQKHEDRLAKRDDSIDRKNQDLDRQEDKLRDRQQSLDDRLEELDAAVAEQRGMLEKMAGLTAEEAREGLLGRIEGEVSEEADRLVRMYEAKAKEEGDDRARSIVATAIQRITSDVTTEHTVSMIQIPNEEMKGRIIGREGRNIRALEAATGCDLIIDDTPDVVTMSSFDPVRREIGRLTLSRLVADGRIHPARIEEQVNKATKEVQTNIREAAEEAALDAKTPGLPKELLATFGRLRYRTSYGQNQLRHAVEACHLSTMIAEELGADVEIVRRGGLLHDIGKAVDHEVDGTHAIIGGELARRFKLSEGVAHCIEAHHEEVETTTVEAMIVQMADSISGGRPGARRESVERYVERLRSLEEIANSFDGVEQSFAIQAGREVRVLVNPKTINDLDSMRLARDISKTIEETLQYPGQIRITVLRETRASEIAR
jgi:ribonuclease Y